MSVTLAVDAMGGDFGVGITIPACCDFLQDHPDTKVIAIGSAQAIEQSIRNCNPNLLGPVNLDCSYESIAQSLGQIQLQ